MVKAKTIHQECRRCKVTRSGVDTFGLKCHSDKRLTYTNKHNKRIKYQHVWLY